MANIYGDNYAKEWISDPSEQADKASRNACVKSFYEEASGISAADEIFICKIQHLVRFISLEAVVGALGAGALNVVDNAGNSTAVTAGDLIDGQIEGGLDLILTADGATSAALSALVKVLLD